MGLSRGIESDLSPDRERQYELLAMAAQEQPFTPIVDGVQQMADTVGSSELVFGQALIWVIISMMPKTHDWGWDLGYMPCLCADLFPERLTSVFRHLAEHDDHGRVGISMNTLYYSGFTDWVLAGDGPPEGDRSLDNDEIVWIALDIVISEAEKARHDGNASLHERWRGGQMEAARAWRETRRAPAVE